MEPKDLFPQPNANPAHAESPKTPDALRRKFERESIQLDVDNYKVEAIAPIRNASPVDKENYLEKISTKDKKSSLFSGKLLILMAVAVILLVIVAAGIILSGGKKVKNASGEALGQRIINLQELVDYGQSNRVSGTEVNKVMSEMNVVLLSRVNDLTPLYATNEKTGFSNPGQEIANQYSNATILTKLDEAKANSSLDDIYTESLLESMQDTESMLKSLYDQSESKYLKASLKKTYDDMQELISRLPE